MTLIHHRGAMKLIHRKYVMDQPCFWSCDLVTGEKETKTKQSKNLASDQCLRSGMTTIKPIESETGRTGTEKVAVPRPLEMQINME